jgi:hypothetical protein
MCLKAKGKFKFAIVQDFITFAIRNGGLAQLARAFAWHARGHRFDSDILHTENKGFTKLCKAFFFSDKTLIKHHFPDDVC